MAKAEISACRLVVTAVRPSPRGCRFALISIHLLFACYLNSREHHGTADALQSEAHLPASLSVADEFVSHPCDSALHHFGRADAAIAAELHGQSGFERAHSRRAFRRHRLCVPSGAAPLSRNQMGE